MNVMNVLLSLPPRPITELQTPPPGTPEFGVAVASAQSRFTLPEKIVRLRNRHPSLKRFPIATTPEPPSMATVQMAVALPVRLPAPQRPAVWLNQPYPVPLPEPGSIGSHSASRP
jgi:hypothetical protein